MKNKKTISFLIVCLLLSVGCVSQNNKDDEKLLTQYKEVNNKLILDCFNKYKEDAEEFCHCLGGLMIIVNNKIICGNSLNNIPYVEVIEYLR